jgi:cryptochrome
MFFREFFYMVSHLSENFDRMEGNPRCKQIDWDMNKEFLKAWEDGMTGYPAIDAAMRQLK